MTPADIAAALHPYGATLNAAGFIQREGKPPSAVRPVVKRGRLRMEANGNLLFSGPATPAAVGRFVESFWFWTKKTDEAKHQTTSTEQSPELSGSGFSPI